MTSLAILHLLNCSPTSLLAMACESCGLPYANHSFICYQVHSPHIHNHGLFTLPSLPSTTTTEKIIPFIFLRNLFRPMFCCLPTSALHRKWGGNPASQTDAQEMALVVQASSLISQQLGYYELVHFITINMEHHKPSGASHQILGDSITVLLLQKVL